MERMYTKQYKSIDGRVIDISYVVDGCTLLAMGTKETIKTYDDDDETIPYPQNCKKERDKSKKVVISELFIPSHFDDEVNGPANITKIGAEVFGSFLSPFDPKENENRKGLNVITHQSDLHFENLMIDDNIYFIDESAFVFSPVDNVYWPEGCTIIKENTFFGSTMSYIFGTDNVREIDANAFDSCNIKEFTVPKNCQCIPDYAFTSCKQLKTIIGLERIREIGEYSFYGSGIEEIDFPPNCEIIPESCFQDCKELRRINIDNVKEIHRKAFKDCCNLKKIFWPEMCSVIPSDCFYGCLQLEEIEVRGKLEKIALRAVHNTKIDKIDISESLTPCLTVASLNDIKIKQSIYQNVIFEGNKTK